MILALREATRREFGIEPFVIVEESWSRLDAALVPDAMYDWFETGKNWATLTEFGGIHVANIVPGYDTTRIETPGRVIDRQRGELFRAGMDAVAPRADLVLIEGFVNVDENAHLVETTTWGRLGHQPVAVVHTRPGRLLTGPSRSIAARPRWRSRRGRCRG